MIEYSIMMLSILLFIGYLAYYCKYECADYDDLENKERIEK